MATATERAADLAFKKLSNREYTSNNKAIYEEAGTVPFKLKGSDIWIEPIPEDPTVLAADDPVVKKMTINLTEDSTVASSLCYKVIKDGIPQGSFIAPRYGQKYTANLIIDGTKILTTHSCGWNFDYEAGLLTFLASPPGTKSRIVQMELFQYIGKTADDLSRYDSTLGNLIIDYSKVTV